MSIMNGLENDMKNSSFSSLVFLMTYFGKRRNVKIPQHYSIIENTKYKKYI